MTADQTTAQPSRTRFSSIIGYLKHYWRYLVGGALAVILANTLVLIEPLLIKKVFDLLEARATSSQILPWILLMFGISVVAGVIGFFTRRTIIWMSHRIEYDLRRDLWSHLLQLSAPFFRATRTGDIMARMTNDLEAVRSMVGPGILHAAETLVTFFVAIPMMLYLSPRLTLYSLAPVVLLPIAVNRLGNMIHHRYAEIQRQYSELTSTVQENVKGARVVRAYRMEQSQQDRFTAMSAKYVNLNLKLARLYGVLFPLTMFVASCLSLSAFYFGGLEVMHGTIPLGTLVAFFVYLGILFWPMFALGGLISLYQRGTASLDRINEFLFASPEIIAGTGIAVEKKIQGHIEFRNLRFRYDKEYALNDINLIIEPGSRVGIVGRTGAGKTTLMSLLARLLPVAAGQIFIDGKDINEWDPKTVREQIGYATQEAFLFSDSIRANVQMGAADIEATDVSRAVDIAGLTPDISHFETGLDTVVGERGVLLSGGQRQRTAIARAIVRNPAILILDDVTSAVDTATEARIRANIRDSMTACTSLIVSHRLAAIRDADVIVFMEQGHILEQGRHEELMALGGAYAALFRSQLLAEELENI